MGVGILIVVAVTAAFNSSWWVANDPAASSSQRAPDGMSLFSQAGQDYALRTRLVLIKLREDATQATALGLPSDGTATAQFDVPIEVRVLGPTGALNVDLVNAVTVITANNRVTAAEMTYDSNGNYRDIIQNLQHLSENVGWTDADFDQLSTDLTAAAASTTSDVYAATLAPRKKLGMAVSAVLTIGASARLLIVAGQISSAQID